MISREQVSYGGSRLMLRFVQIVTRMEIRIGIQKNRCLITLSIYESEFRSLVKLTMSILLEIDRAF